MRLRIVAADETVLTMRKGVAICSISQISRLLAVDRATVARVIRNQGITPAGERRTNPVYALPEVAKCLFINK